MGEWMKANGAGPGEIVLARKRQVAFYAGAQWQWLPLTDTAGLEPYAQERDARFVVIDERTAPTLRPQLAYLLDPGAAPAWLRPVHAETEPPRIVLYRVEP
jgi:hypothetical protein